MAACEPDADLEVRPPKQRRSREAWNRVLDAGVAILEDGGYDAFTIAAVCERARVAPPAIYARTDQQGRALPRGLRARHRPAARPSRRSSPTPARWAGLAPAELVRDGGRRDGGHLAAGTSAFLRAVVLDLGGPPRGAAARGPATARSSASGFAGVVLRAADADHARRPGGRRPRLLRHRLRRRRSSGWPTARRSPRRTGGRRRFVADLAETAVRYLLGGDPG